LIQLVLQTRKLLGLDSKYLTKYARQLGRGNVLHYRLHQLRNDEYGTVSGRYSSSNINIQQVFKSERNEEYLPEFVIRELFIPAPGKHWVSADANQIEFRLFAHYSDSTQLIKAYQEDPNTDFHQVVAELTNLKRSPAKNLNFAKIYGAGLDKAAEMMGVLPEEAEPVMRKYDRMFPEAKRLMNQAMNLAATRGYVKTILGRRGRFPEQERLHSALNRVIQGTAADIMKLKLLEAYNNRRLLTLTLRFPVHDELNGDLENPEKVKPLRELLDSPSLPIKVPITWVVKLGKNWRET
jgi:DNA polymerase-1